MARELNWSASATEAAITGYAGKIRRLLEAAGLSQEGSVPVR